MDLRQSLPSVPVILMTRGRRLGEAKGLSDVLCEAKGPQFDCLRAGMTPGWLRGPFTAERRGLPMAGEFSWDANGVLDISQTGGTLSGDGVLVRELP